MKQTKKCYRVQKTFFLTTGFFRILSKLHHVISRFNLFGNKANKLLFKPEKEVTIIPFKSKMRIETEKHYHKKNTHPLAEKQSLLKNKKKAKGSD
jgi:hypothetical protein